MIFHKNSAEYNLAGEINRDSIMSLCDFIDVSTHYYCYDDIKIRIDSPGGQLSYLNHYLYKINELTDARMGQVSRDLIIRTKGLSVVASAAAVLMSMGSVGYRTCCRTCQLCYHGARVQLDGTITKEKADELYYGLKEKDEQIVDQLVAQAVLSISEQFVERMRNNQINKTLSKDPGGKKGHFGSGFRKEYKFLKRLYDNILNKKPFDSRARLNLKNRLKSIYHKLFANDVFISSDEAQFLLLVDQII